MIPHALNTQGLAIPRQETSSEPTVEYLQKYLDSLSGKNGFFASVAKNLIQKRIDSLRAAASIPAQGAETQPVTEAAPPVHPTISALRGVASSWENRPIPVSRPNMGYLSHVGQQVGQRLKKQRMRPPANYNHTDRGRFWSRIGQQVSQ